ncbi:hypothetical protein PsorP6_006354 [Peronosclerospora sorghi]|uniref:Uncharacterized protein n=1 Tax=Peronosclerospora sorghi TaxID=230839 RepID=A0ACC0W304_9STRA|nr:hypothetical protein PsorP6_006354 [Peronosclerospora sorghi]
MCYNRNTVGHAWTEATLEQKVCNFAISVSSTSSVSSKTIADTVIVTHSMDGLMMAGALANERCKIASSTTWDVGKLEFPNDGDYEFRLPPKGLPRENIFLKDVANLIGRCPANNAILSLAYENE